MSKLHLDYEEYKQLIGDNGVTEWTKYNWLSGPENLFFGGFKRVKISDLTWTWNSQYSFYITTDINNDIRGVTSSIPVNGYLKGFQAVSYDDRTIAGKRIYYDSVSISPGLVIRGIEQGTLPTDSYLIYEVKPEYERLQYIESTGTQYIDTGYVGNQNTLIRGKFYIGQNTQSTGLMGKYNNETTSISVTINNAAIANSRFGDRYFASTWPINDYEITISKEAIIVNGTENVLDAKNIFTTTDTLAICHTKANVNTLTGKTYYVQIEENNNLIRDFIPVRKKDGTVGMLDIVNNKFYGNSGTGDFIAGPLFIIQ